MSANQPHAAPEGMFGTHAWMYDRIYGRKKYRPESEFVRDTLRGLGVSDGARLLDAACGTGKHLEHLREWYDAAGFDLSPQMIEIARGRLPGTSLWTGDLADFDVASFDGRPYDALTCLFSAIGCVYPAERLLAAARCMFAALRPGGVALVEPWLEPDAFRDGTVHTHASLDEVPHLVRMCTSTREGRHTILDFHWLIGDGEGVEHLHDRHVLWMCPRAELVAVFEAAGFEVTWDDEGSTGRGLLVGRRPQ